MGSEQEIHGRTASTPAVSHVTGDLEPTGDIRRGREEIRCDIDMQGHRSHAREVVESPELQPVHPVSMIDWHPALLSAKGAR